MIRQPVAGTCLGFLLLGGLAAPAAAQAPAPAAAIDALPEGAVARLGSARFWHGADIRALAFAPGDKLLASYGLDSTVCVWDASGKLLRRIPIPKASEVEGKFSLAALRGLTLVFSGDARALAVLDSFGGHCAVYDVASGRELHRAALESTGLGGKGLKGSLSLRLLAGPFALSRDGAVLAMPGRQDAVVVWDGRKKAERWRLAGHKGAVHALALAADGKALLSAGADRTLRLWDLDTGKEIRTLRGHRAAVLAAAFLPGGRLLSASADGTLRVWDRATGKQLLRARWLIGPAPEAPLTAARFGADVPTGPQPRLWHDAEGKEVGCVYLPEDLGIARNRLVRTEVFVCFDAATGKRVCQTQITSAPASDGAPSARVQALATAAAGTALGHSGKLLARALPSQHVQLVRLENGEEIPPDAGGGAAVTEVALAGDRVAFTRRGDRAVYLADWRAGGPPRRLAGHTGVPSDLRFTPDGKELISASGETTDRVLTVWNAARGEEARQLGVWDPLPPLSNPGFGRATRDNLPWRLELSPDGKLLAVRRQDGKLRLVEVATGKEPAHPDVTWKGRAAAGFTPDGKGLVVSDATDDTSPVWGKKKGAKGDKAGPRSTLQLVDLAGGQPARELPKGGYNFLVSRLAVTERFVLLGCQDGSLRLVDRGSGEVVRTVVEPGKPLPPRGSRLTVDASPALLPAPDGRSVAVLSPQIGSLRLLEVATGHERARFKGPLGPIQCFGFAPDGRHLATGSQDGTVLIWALLAPRPAAGAAAPPDEKELAGLWDELAREDASRAFRAMRRLAGAPGQAVGLLQHRLKPAAPLDELAIRQRLRQLDSQSFSKRQTAERELAEMGEGVIPALQSALGANPSEEAKGRLGALVVRLREGVPGKDRLREMRAVEVLEAVGTVPACAVLRQLAGGDPRARLTREARAALARLACRTE